MIRVTLLAATVLMMSGCAAMCGSVEGPGKGQAVAAGDGLGPGAVIHYVRIRSGLPDDEAMMVLRERAARFRDVPGLVQKIYGRDAESGEICGIYIFESQAAFNRFRQSELALTIRDAYRVESARIERYDVLFTLYPGVRRE